MSGDASSATPINGLRFIFAFAGSTLVTADARLVSWLGGGDASAAGS